MPYMALYRKFRPQTFDQVKGQDHVVRTLRNQIKNNRIGHAYLFCGTRGTGKTSVAKLFARAINCLDSKDGEPCGVCENCRTAMKDSFIDIVEVDAASNTGVDDIRRIIDEIMYTPVKGRYKVYIIDEAHMLTGPAFNAFLKTLEEPPSYAVFILATTEPHKLPVTILSRCQRYDFHRIGTDTIAENLKTLVNAEGVEADDRALRYIARMGDGSMRDSVSLLDKCISFNLGEKLTYDNVLKTLGAADTDVFSRVFNAVYSGEAIPALKELEAFVSAGGDISRFISDLIWYLRSMLLLTVDKSTGAEMLGISEENLAVLADDAEKADAAVLMRYIRILSELINEIRYSPSKQILCEVAFIKLARPQMESDSGSLADRIRQLEAKLEGKAAAAQPHSGAGAYKTHSLPDEDSCKIPNGDAGASYKEDTGDPSYEIRKTTVQADDASFAAPAQADEAPLAAAVQQDNASLIASSWGDIVEACPNQSLKMSLKKARVAEDPDGQVWVLSGGKMALEIIRERAGEVNSLILKVTGRDVRINVKPDDGREILTQPAGTDNATAEGLSESRSYKNDAASSSAGDIGGIPGELLKNIHFDINTEEN